ncbi:MAG TPA: cupin domain-containing protein [Gemmatimonadaceae bacterium]
MTRIRYAAPMAVALVALLASLGQGQDTAHFVAAGRVSVRHLSALPRDSVPGLRAWIVVGTVGSLSLIELGPGVPSAAADHYHAREQINVGLTGTTDVQLDSRHIPLSRATSIVVPPNVVHVARNQTFAPVSYFEFHVVRRPDLVPPFQPIAFPRAPAPSPLDPTAKVVLGHDFANGSSVPGEGKTCSFRVHVIRSGSTLEIADSGDEHFWYSLGKGTVVERNGVSQSVDANSIVVVPPSSGLVRVTASETPLTLLHFVVHPDKP